MIKSRILLLNILLLFSIELKSQTARQEVNFSGSGWRVWHGNKATWQNDTLFLPRTLDLSKVKSNDPTCGWKDLYSKQGIQEKVPATFEELFGNGDRFWRYHGVGWFTKEVEIPAEWNSKTVTLSIEKARLRFEIYINEQQAGHDIVAETPYSADISSYLQAEQTNRIDIRVTYSGGQRGCNDSPVTECGKTKLCSGHNFGGLGNISFTTTSNCYISEVFVKNILPAKANDIEIQVSVKNKELSNKTPKIEAEIISCHEGKKIATNRWEANSGPVGLDSFENNYPKKSHDAFFLQPDKLLLLIGEIAYGKRENLLGSSYPVDVNNALNNLIFLI